MTYTLVIGSSVFMKFNWIMQTGNILFPHLEKKSRRGVVFFKPPAKLFMSVPVQRCSDESSLAAVILIFFDTTTLTLLAAILGALIMLKI